MPVKRIRVANFKSFSEIDIDLCRFNVVIGSNAAGKSNFIGIFKFLRDIARNGLINAIAMQGGVEYIRNAKIGNTRDLEIMVVYQPDPTTEFLDSKGTDGHSLCMELCESSYEFALRFDSHGDAFSIIQDRLVIGCEISSCLSHDNTDSRQKIGRGEIRITVQGGEIHYDVVIPEGCTLTERDFVPLFFRGKRLPAKTLLLETPYAYPLPHAEKFFERIAVYDFDPKLPKKGVAITGKRDLEEDGSNLALAVKNITDNPEKKRKFANLLRDVLPFVEDFSVQKFMDVSLILTMRERYAKAQDLPAFSLSDGTITIFDLIIALYFEENPFIVIEEPVSHIHPFLIGRIVAMMKEASAKKQVMVSTHSAEVVKHAHLADILLISRDSEGFSIISRPADKEEVRTFLENEIGIEEPLYPESPRTLKRMKKRLFILVEGEDDVRFFGRIIKPLLAPRYDSVEIIPYACIKRGKVNNFLKSVRQMGNDYIFVADIDQERSVRDKKQILYYRFHDIDGGSIVIVIKEIESWYYAGLPQESLQKLGVPALPSTNNLTKEDFNQLIPRRFDSRIDFMFEILKFFSVDSAVKENRSFKFFSDRYHLNSQSDRET